MKEDLVAQLKTNAKKERETAIQMRTAILVLYVEQTIVKAMVLKVLMTVAGNVSILKGNRSLADYKLCFKYRN